MASSGFRWVLGSRTCASQGVEAMESTVLARPAARIRGASRMAVTPRRALTRAWCRAFVVAGLTAVAVPASGQVSVEIGVHGGSACLNGGAACTGSFLGPFAALEWDRRVALRLRHLDVDLDDHAIRYGAFAIRRRNRHGQLVLGEVVYQFGRRSRIQPFVGASLGHREYRQVTTCSPVSCAEASATPGGPGVAGGLLRNSRFTAGGIGGVIVRAGGRVTIQALVGFHDPWQEHGETVEGALLVGVSVWRSR